MRNLFLTLIFITSSAFGQSTITYPYKDIDGSIKQVDALLRVPASTDLKKAVIVLHTAGGYLGKSTEQYGEYFQNNNFISLEPKMFATKSENPLRHLSQVFGALSYLKSRNDVDKDSISIVGLSYGASLSIYAITKWANQNFNDGQVGFKSVFALYPTCFFHQNLMQKDSRTVNRLKMFGFPDKFHDEWLGVPLKIFAGGQDDYENREGQPCFGFYNSIADESQKKLTSITNYPNATHRWDASHNHTFNDPLACKWKGCAVNVIADVELTEKVKLEIVEAIRKQP